MANEPGLPSTEQELERVRAERSLFLKLLQLSERDDLQGFLAGALELVLELADAQKGYLELHDGSQERPRWWIAAGCTEDEIEGIRDAISRGIIAQAVASGRTVATASAVTDPRFEGYHSVQVNQIEAVLCAPVGGPRPSGVLYLQGRRSGGPFGAVDQRHAELFARHLAPLADRLLLREDARQRSDATQPWRTQLDVDNIVGRSAAMADVLRTVALAAPLDIGVLITGPTGTGKTEVARAIHRNSPRSDGPLVEVNCAAIPETLVESELFGAVPGAATGVTRRMDGKVTAADGGTLFLDEIGELPMTSQAKLLELLHGKRFFRLGSSRKETADIRIIAATNQDLEQAVAEHRFREDLYFRLAVLPLRLPALAERIDDVPPLAEHLLERAVLRHRLPRMRLSPAALVAATAADWPGNVRELANAMERAAVIAAGEGAAAVEPRHLFAGASAEPAEAGPATFQEATRRFQRELLARTLDDTGWNVSETARRLDLARSYLYDLIHAHGLRREES